MIMRMRQPNRRRFKSKLKERRRREREYLYASVSVLVVKIVLFVFLCILFPVSVRLFHARFPHVTPMLRYAVPGIVAIFACILLAFIVKNIMQIRDEAKNRR